MVIFPNGHTDKNKTETGTLENCLDQALTYAIKTNSDTIQVELPVMFTYYTSEVQKLLTTYRQVGWSVDLLPWQTGNPQTHARFGNDKLQFARRTHYGYNAEQLYF